MKRQCIVYVILLIAGAVGCYKMNLGPKTDVVDNGAEGRWILVSYFVRGRRHANTDVPEKALLRAETREVHADSTYPSKIYQKGYRYRIFHFSDLTGGAVSKIMAMGYGHDYSKKRKEETHWFRLDNDYGFQVILDLDLEKGISTKLEMSNVMKSETYRAELDTVKYIYVANP